MNPPAQIPGQDGIRVFLLKAFTRHPHGGNAAGVVIDADAVDTEKMLQIAARIGYSETAFIQASAAADFKVRFFTPQREVDLCGHATIATYYCLWKARQLAPGEYTQETRAGVLKVRVDASGSVEMEQCRPKFGEPLVPGMLEPVLGATACAGIDNGLPLSSASTGLADLFVPVRSRAELFALQPDMAAMRRLNQRTGTIGCHFYTMDTMDPSHTCHCRNFAPAAGIPEEAATGSSSGALACLLARAGRAGPRQVFEQGHVMNSPSEIRVSLDITGDEIRSVFLGGHACIIGERSVCIS